MVETQKQLKLEKRILFTLATLFVYTVMLITILDFVSYYDSSIEKIKWLLYSLPFAVFSILIKGANLRHKQKKRLKIFSIFILLGLFIITTLRFHPNFTFNDFQLNKTYLHPLGAIFLAYLSWKLFYKIAASLNLIFLVPQMKLTMGKDFHNWLHNYLQAHSVIKKCNQIKKIMFIFIIITIFCIIGATIYTHNLNNTAIILVAISLIVFHFTTMNIFKYELFINWITQDIDEKPQFFHRWFITSVVYISLIGAISFLIMPLNLTVIQPKNTISSVRNFFLSFYKTTQPDYKSMNKTIKRRNIANKVDNKIKYSKPSESPVKKILRFAFYSSPLLFLLAIFGGVMTRKYRYKKIPSYLTIPIYLWRLFKIFLSIFGFVVKMLFFLFPKKRPLINLNDAKSQRFKGVFKFDEEKLSEEKRKELKDIIEMYLSFIENAEERGIFYKTGETPNEFTRKVIITLPKIKKEAKILTSVFYLSRYSQITIAINKKEEAKTSLEICLAAMKKMPILEE